MKAEKPKYTAVVGTEAKLVCIGEEVKHDPFTLVSWLFNGKKVNKSDNHYHIDNDFYALKIGSIPKVRTQLSVFNVRYEDSGNYTCKVTSDVIENDERDTVMLEVISRGMK